MSTETERKWRVGRYVEELVTLTETRPVMKFANWNGKKWSSSLDKAARFRTEDHAKALIKRLEKKGVSAQLVKEVARHE